MEVLEWPEGASVGDLEEIANKKNYTFHLSEIHAEVIAGSPPEPILVCGNQSFLVSTILFDFLARNDLLPSPSNSVCFFMPEGGRLVGCMIFVDLEV